MFAKMSPSRSFTSGVLRLFLTVVGGLLLVGCSAAPARSPTQVTIIPAISPVASPEPRLTQAPEPAEIGAPVATGTAVAAEPFPYGLVYALDTDSWSESDRPAVRAQMKQLADMGVNTIVQTFSSRLVGTGSEADWLILLDEAEANHIQVIARLWPLDEWDGRSTPFPEVAAFLKVVSGHPALKAYLGLHEPLEHYTSAQMRLFYEQIKAIAPLVPVAHYLGDLAYFDDSVRFPRRQFSAGICDVCIVWCTPARYLDGQPYLDDALLSRTVTTNRALVDSRSPTSELWFLGQAYALGAHRHQLRMPEPDEMAVIFRVARTGGVDGFLWYPWFHGAYDQVLGDLESRAQQEAVSTIAREELDRREAEAQPVQSR